MAKRRKTTKRRTSRRRASMSGIGSGLGAVLPMVLGAVAGRIISNKLSGKASAAVLGAGQIGVGLVLPSVIKNNFVKGIGTGMIINGAVSLAQSTGVISAISGIGEMEVDFLNGMDTDFDTMEGTDNLSIIANVDEGIMSGSSDLSVIAGDFEDMEDSM
jgi:hypothetical protein